MGESPPFPYPSHSVPCVQRVLIRRRHCVGHVGGGLLGIGGGGGGLMSYVTDVTHLMYEKFNTY